ncbi:MAG: cellulase family glycosylhydrolase [Bacteroidales bacterium]|nr:cellulase family glycosylhydrolase [Bacteroidales bacterium]
MNNHKMKRMLMPGSLHGLVILLLLSCQPKVNNDYLRRDGTQIVNNQGPFLIRAINFGNWMVQESYMMKTKGVFPQHKVKQLINGLIGEEKSAVFYDTWRANFVTEADVIHIKALGFNAIRLPMHYNLFTLPIESEAVKGENTWLETGFILTDSLLSWCTKHEVYLILDLHAAPGGQGKDANINDYDAEKPSLWENPLNQEKTIALWAKLASRYANEPWIGGYDLINETNWTFEEGKQENGLNDTSNLPLQTLMMDITKAVRAVDQHHILFVEGNGWANNYHGLTPPWDSNMVYSFHHYWQRNETRSIQRFLDMREKYQVPFWMGESGENSNEWFAEAIQLFELHGIGWAWWPYKKFDSRTCLMEVPVSPEYQKILDYQANPVDSLKPDPEFAFRALMQLAENHKLVNCKLNRGYHDAMFRQVVSNATLPFAENKVPGKICAVDYDLGRMNQAYHDEGYANFWVTDGGDGIDPNEGGFYRNDGVDITTADDPGGNGFCVFSIADGEWMKYTLNVTETALYQVDTRVLNEGQGGGKILFQTDGNTMLTLDVPPSDNKQWISLQADFRLEAGQIPMTLRFVKGGFKLSTIAFTKK